MLFQEHNALVPRLPLRLAYRQRRTPIQHRREVRDLLYQHKSRAQARPRVNRVCGARRRNVTLVSLSVRHEAESADASAVKRGCCSATIRTGGDEITGSHTFTAVNVQPHFYTSNYNPKNRFRIQKAPTTCVHLCLPTLPKTLVHAAQPPLSLLSANTSFFWAPLPS